MFNFFPNKIPADQVEALICRAIEGIVSVVPDCRILLFGSAARGEMNSASDLDFIVLIPDHLDLKESSRKIWCSGHWGFWPIDLVFFRESEFAEKKALGGVAFLAAQEGRFVFPANKNGRQNDAQ